MTIATTIKGGASAPLTTRQAWDSALAAYQLAKLLHDADEAFGPTSEANRTYEDDRVVIEREYGGLDRARSTPDGLARWERAWQRVSQAERKAHEAYVVPLWKAMRDLVQAPAPDIAAVRLKVDLIAKEEVWNDRELEADCFDLIRADVERLREAL